MLNFTMSELLHSETAIENNIENLPNKESMDNMLELIFYCLQPIRDKLKRPIIVTSGYRGKELNKIIGGVHNSQHCKGQAVDIKINGMRPDELSDFIHNSGVEYDQLIVEYGSWVHLSYNRGNNRRMRFAIS